MRRAGRAEYRTVWTPERIAALTRDVAIVVIGGIILGLFAAAATTYYVVAAMAVAAIISLIVWQFEIVLVIYALAAFVPWGRTPDIAVGGSGVGKGLYVSEALLAFLLAIWFVKYLFRALPANRIRSGFHIPLALYLAYGVLNVIHSFIFWDPHVNRMYQYPHVNAVELGFRFLSAGAFIMMATTIEHEKWLRWTTLMLCLPGLYNLANALAGGIVPVSAPWWPLLTFLPVCYCWAIVLDARTSVAKKLGAAVVIGAAFFQILVRSVGWVSGWFGLFTGLAAVTYGRSRKAFFILASLAAISVIIFWPFFYEHVIVASKEEGDYDRFALMKGAWLYATHFPLGVGMGNYRTYNSFHYGVEWGTTAYTSAHGTYAQHLSEMGIPGLVLFLAILVSGGRWMLSKYRELEPGLSKTYLLAAFGQLVGISCTAFIGDYIIPTYHNGGLVTFCATVYSWLIWGLAVAHVRMSQVAVSSKG
ncbi:MAG: O-antigen ligase family protein [Armatimonadota bacterium]|nr:O-antigen ligase family protein [Armatimonadota bacterium]